MLTTQNTEGTEGESPFSRDSKRSVFCQPNRALKPQRPSIHRLRRWPQILAATGARGDAIWEVFYRRGVAAYFKDVELGARIQDNAG